MTHVPPPSSALWRWFRWTCGWLLIGLGILGLVLPGLQGILFIVIGAAVVGHRSRPIRWFRVLIRKALRRASAWPGVFGRSGRWLAKQHRHLRHRLHAAHRRRAERRAGRQA